MLNLPITASDAETKLLSNVKPRNRQAMLDNPYAKAALGALLIGAGIVLILQASKLVPCVDCGEAEEVAAEVAAASAEMTEPIGDID